MTPLIVNLTMDGTDIPYVVPDKTASIALQATGGDVEMKTTVAGGDPVWTLVDKRAEAIDARTISKATLYFNGVAPRKVQIRILEAPLC